MRKVTWLRMSPADLPLDLALLAECDRRDELRIWREPWPFGWFPPAPAKYSRTGWELGPRHPLLWVTAKVWPAVVE